MTCSPEAISSNRTPLSHCITGLSELRTSGVLCSRSAPNTSMTEHLDAKVIPMQQTPYWTVAFTERDAQDVSDAVIGSCDRDDAVRRSLDVLGEGVSILWVEPRHTAAVLA